MPHGALTAPLKQAYSTSPMESLSHRDALLEAWEQADERLQDDDLSVELEIRALEGLAAEQLRAIMREEPGTDRSMAAAAILGRETVRLGGLRRSA